MIHSICSVVAVFKMLVRILNTLPSRIWNVSLFLFSVCFKSTVWQHGMCQKNMTFREIKSKRAAIQFVGLRQNGTFSTTEQNQTYKNSLFFRIPTTIQQKTYSLWRIPILTNCRFRIVRKKKKQSIPDAASEHV